MSEQATDQAQTQLGRSALTPLLDVLFLLLFAVLATAERDRASSPEDADQTQEIDVRLPELEPSDEPAQGQGDTRRVELLVAVDGTVVVRSAGTNADVRSSVELSAALDALSVGSDEDAGDAPVIVEVRADADARHAVVVEVLQTLWSRGITDVRYVAAVERDANGDREFGGGAR